LSYHRYRTSSEILVAVDFTRTLSRLIAKKRPITPKLCKQSSPFKLGVEGCFQINGGLITGAKLAQMAFRKYPKAGSAWDW